MTLRSRRSIEQVKEMERGTPAKQRKVTSKLTHAAEAKQHRKRSSEVK